MSSRSKQVAGGRGRVAGSFAVVLGLALTSRDAAVGQAPAANHLLPTTCYTPHRVYDTRHKEFIDFESLVSGLTTADLVFVGEQHDDPATHRMELAILEGIARRRDSVVVALEMFERDVQPLLDRYLAGEIPEDSLLKAGRPWKNYAGDYRPLVELARAKSWPVIASNVPRPLASLVARTSLAGLDTLPPETRRHGAEILACPKDAYRDRFVKALGDLSAHGPPPAAGNSGGATDPEEVKARVERMYQAQCLKDETMGESVSRAWSGAPGRLVIHYDGAFHTDYRMGTAERAHRRVPAAKMVVVTAMPVKNLDELKPSKDDRKRADYLLYVLAPAKPDTAGR